MPFPLAHPAAVLPLRRYSPKYLSFPALVAGSISPDLSYAFSRFGVDDLAHSAVAGTVFGIGTGFLLLLLYHWMVALVRKYAPATYERIAANGPASQPAISAVILSLAIGTWTHLLLDSITHSHGWLALHFTLLRTPLWLIHGRTVRVCHLLWYGCSFVGVAWLVLAAYQWQDRICDSRQARPRKSHALEATLAAMLVLPIELVHHLVRSRLGLILVSVLTGGVALIILGRIAARICSRSKEPVLRWRPQTRRPHFAKPC